MTHPRPIRWVFLDRDGTINKKAPEYEYVTTPQQVELLSGAAEAISALNDAGVWVGVVTNQRGIARGKLSERDLRAIHARLCEHLARQGAHVDAIYHCPHAEDGCECRKPKPGLLLRAQADQPALSFAETAVVGDSASDVQAGQRVGASTVLLAHTARTHHGADHVARTLLDAVRWLCEERGLAAGPQEERSA